jgi:hypothetical protein
MRVSLVCILGSRFLCRIHVPPRTLISYIVIYGNRLFLVFPVTSIILLFLMIAHIIFGLFHCASNLTHCKCCHNSLPMSNPSLANP